MSVRVRSRDNAYRHAPGMRRKLRRKDRELVAYVARHGVVGMDDVVVAAGVNRTTAHARVARCVELGLVERRQLPLVSFRVLRATPFGLRVAGYRGWQVAPVCFGSVEHQLQCADVAQVFVEEFGAESVLTEREIRIGKGVEGNQRFSTELGAGQRHYPDLVAVVDDGVVVGEVELSPKGPKRLRAILEAWAAADTVKEVRYYCSPGLTLYCVRQELETVKASMPMRVFELPGRATQLRRSRSGGR